MTYSVAGTGNTRELGQRLRDTRHKRGLLQAELAAILEVSPAALSRWECGTRNPNPAHAERISLWLQQINQQVNRPASSTL